MTDQQFADAKWRFQNYATHSDGCEYITTLRESLITRPRGKVSECDCWNGSTLTALDYAEKRIAELEADKARLDFLESTCPDLHNIKSLHLASNLRDAIDAMMQARPVAK